MDQLHSLLKNQIDIVVILFRKDKLACFMLYLDQESGKHQTYRRTGKAEEIQEAAKEGELQFYLDIRMIFDDQYKFHDQTREIKHRYDHWQDDTQRLFFAEFATASECDIVDDQTDRAELR